jgi:signal transduction histidine kinase
MADERVPTSSEPEGPDGDAAAEARSAGEFVGAVTHALKGLLNGLDGGLYLLESGYARDDRERAGQGLEMVKRNAALLRNMVGCVLYYAKSRAVDPQPVDLGEAAEAAARAVALPARQAGVELNAGSDGRTALVDPVALNALLVNLIEQSVDSFGDQSPPAARKVEARVRLEGEELLVDVTHAGRALDSENRARVLSSLYVTRGCDRSVLWAFAAHRVAGMSGGRFEIEDAPDGGTRFRASLPARESGRAR